MIPLNSLEEFKDLLSEKRDFVLFKHSSRCSISGGACRETYQAIEELGLDNVYLLDVLDTGDLKHEIADEIGVKHESPQIIIFEKGKPKDHASHGTISKGWIVDKLKGRHDTRA